MSDLVGGRRSAAAGETEETTSVAYCLHLRRPKVNPASLPACAGLSRQRISSWSRATRVAGDRRDRNRGAGWQVDGEPELARAWSPDGFTALRR